MKKTWNLTLALYFLAVFVCLLVRETQNDTWPNCLWLFISCLVTAQAFHRYERERKN